MHLLLYKFLNRVLPKDEDGRYIADKNEEHFRIKLIENDVHIENMDNHEIEIKTQKEFFNELMSGFSLRKKQRKEAKKISFKR